MHKKSQTWVTEFLLSFLIFSSAILLSVKLMTNAYTSDNFDVLLKESEYTSNALLSAGYPYNWTNSTIIRLGLVTSNTIDSQKLASLYNMDYQTSKKYLNANYDYFFFLTYNNTILNIFNMANSTNSSVNVCGYGYSGVNQSYYNGTCHVSVSGLNYAKLVKFNRLVVFNNSITTLNLYMWSK